MEIIVTENHVFPIMNILVILLKMMFFNICFY